MLRSNEGQEDSLVRNPDRPANIRSTMIEDDVTTSKKSTTRMTSPEKWEIKQVCNKISITLFSLSLSLSL